MYFKNIVKIGKGNGFSITVMGWQIGVFIAIAAIVLNLLFSFTNQPSLIILTYLILISSVYFVFQKKEYLLFQRTERNIFQEQWFWFLICCLFLLLGYLSVFWISAVGVLSYIVSIVGFSWVFPWKSQAVTNNYFGHSRSHSQISQAWRRKGMIPAVIIFILVLGFWGQFYIYKGYDFKRSLPYGLPLFSLALIFLYFFNKNTNQMKSPDNYLSPKKTQIFLAIILSVGVLFRIYKFTSFPWGLFPDESILGQEINYLVTGLGPAINFDGRWGKSPFMAGWGDVFMLPLCFNALFIKILGPSEFSLRLVHLIFGCLSVFIFFRIAKILMSVRSALLATLIFATYRMHIYYSRFTLDLHLIFFELLLIYFFLKAFVTGKKIYYIFGGLALGLSLYTYVPAKVFPILLCVIAFYLSLKNKHFWGQHSRAILFVTLLVLLVTGPMIYFLYVNPGVFWGQILGRTITSGSTWLQSVSIFFGNSFREFFMFNNNGDSLGWINLPNQPYLDFVAGIFFVFGLFLAIFNWRKERYFFCLSWFLIALLPAIFAKDNPRFAHAVAVLPLPPLFVGFFLESLETNMVYLLPRKGIKVFSLFGVGLVCIIAVLNFKILFFNQVNNMSVYGDQAGDRTSISRDVAWHGNKARAYLTMNFFGDPSLDFLTSGQNCETQWLDFTENIPIHDQPNRDSIFYFNAHYFPVIDLLKKYYPGGQEKDYKDLRGDIFCKSYLVPKEEFNKKQGLMGKYFKGKPGSSRKPFLERLDQYFVFDWEKEKIGRPFSVEWEGFIYCERFGIYKFRIKGNDKNTLWLDDKRVTFADSRGVLLQKGMHRIKVTISNQIQSSLALEWMRAVGANEKSVGFVVVPQNVLSTIWDGHYITAEYFKNQDWKGAPDLEVRDPFLLYLTNLPWGIPLSVKWEGKIQVKKDGNYSFDLETDEQSWLFVDQKPVINNNRMGWVSLKKGMHNISLKSKVVNFPLYFKVFWKSPDGPREILPHEIFVE